MLRKIADRLSKNRLIQKVKSPFLVLATGLLIGLPTATLAQTSVGAAIGNALAKSTIAPFLAALNILAAVLGYILAWLNKLLVFVIDSAIGPALETLFARTGGEVTIVYDMWNIVLGVANVLFFLALLIASILIIARYSGYNLKKAITGLVTAAIVANISYPIAQILIFDLGDTLASTARSIFGYSLDDVVGFFGGTFMQSFNGALNPAVDWRISILQPVMVIVVQVILAIVLFKLGFILVERAVRLIYTTIAAPIYFALSLFPAKELQGLASQWWSEMIKWILVLPIALALISGAMKFYYTYFTSDVNVAGELMKVVDDSAQMSGDFWSNLIIFIIVIALLLAAGSADKMVGVSLAAITAGGANWLGNVSTAGGKALGKYTKTAAGTWTARGLETVGGTKMGAPVAKMVRGVQSFFENQKRIRDTETERRKLAVQSQGNEAIMNIYQDLADKRKVAIDQIMEREGLKPEEKFKAEAMFEKERPDLAKKYATYDKMHTSILVEARKLQQDIGYSPEALAQQIEELVQQINNGDTSIETRTKLAGMSTRLAQEADKTGPQSVPFKAAMIKLMADPSITETIKRDATNKWWPKEPPAISEKDLERYEERQASKVTEKDYSELAINQQALKEATTEASALQRELDVLANSDPTIHAALRLATQASAEDLDHYKQVTEDTVRDQLASTDSVALDALESLLNDRQKSTLKSIRRSNKPAAEKQKELSDYLLTITGVFGSGDEATVKDISELLVKTDLDVDKLKDGKTIARAAQKNPKITEFIDKSRATITPRIRVERLRQKFARANHRTPAYSLAIKNAVARGVDTTTLAPELTKLIQDIATAYNKPLADNPSVKPSDVPASALEDAAEIQKRFFEIQQKLDIPISNKGKIITDAAELGDVSTDRLMSEVHRMLDAIRNQDSSPKNTTKNKNASEEEEEEEY
ncbi:MAG: hypothetical protein PHR51_01800 [Patescibacteria group bacterium]|nr:hypothetical protein [Patescibacteria group bacterium]